MARLTLNVVIERLALKSPFRISGVTFTEIPVVVATIGDGATQGRGEAAGVYYLGDAPESMVAQVEAIRSEVERGISREELAMLLPAGGARNALDCALWELESNRAGVPVWKLAGLDPPRPLVTTFTIGADDPETCAAGALAHDQARALKLKLTGEVAADIERVRSVRAARPGVWLAVDANQGFTPDTLHEMLPVLREARVALLEQPLARGREADLDGFDCGIAIAADESALVTADVAALVGRFDIVNVKLDKCGGLTEGLAMVAKARRLSMKTMVGNMVGTSLAMAPGFVLGQLCDVVDLDGPTFLVADRAPGVVYADGLVDCPASVWG